MAEVCAIIFCVALNGLLASFETAFVAISKPYILAVSKEKQNREVEKLIALKEAPERTLSVVQVGITFLGAFAAAIGGIEAERYLRPAYIDFFSFSEATSEILALFTVTALITYFSVVFGELIPKVIALRRPMKVATLFSGLVSVLILLFFPVVILLEYSTTFFLYFLPRAKRGKDEGGIPLLEEFSSMSDPSKKYIKNIFNIEKSTLCSIAIPLEKIDLIEIESTFDEVEELIIKSGHTRIPVAEGGTIRGILNAKEFLALKKTGDENWGALVHPAVTLYEKSPLLTAFRRMQKARSHMAIVRNLNGYCWGVVTMEDIFEEIVGEIYDEDDDGSLLKILSKRR